MTPYQQVQSLITLAEQKYIENYYGNNLALFTRNETPVGTDADAQYTESVKG